MHGKTNGKRITVAAITALMLCGAADPIRAEVRMPGIFGDHMVLQREADIPVWGQADPGETAV